MVNTLLARSYAVCMTDYIELHCHSNFSLLDGASHPEELLQTLAHLGRHVNAAPDCFGGGYRESSPGVDSLHCHRRGYCEVWRIADSE